MAEEANDKLERTLKQIGTVLATLGGTVVVFYALGFMIVQCFISSADVDGMFWFSREYYEEAGGKFIVEVVRTPLMKPVFFVAYLGFLIYLLPGGEEIKKIGASSGIANMYAQISFPERIKALVLLGVALLTYFFVVSFETAAASNLFADKVAPVFFWTGDTPKDQEHSLLFFSLTVPVIIALALLLQRLYKHIGNKGLTRTALLLFIVFASILPISYGRYLYDIKAVPISNPDRIYKLSGIQKSDVSDSSKMWFLGRFGGKYLFLRIDNLFTNPTAKIKDIALGKTQGVVESLNEADVKIMNFTLDRADSLRRLMKSSKNGTFEQEAQKAYDTLFQK